MASHWPCQQRDHDEVGEVNRESRAPQTGSTVLIGTYCERFHDCVFRSMPYFGVRLNSD